MSLKFCIRIESNSQRTFFPIILYTNMAVVTSCENQELPLTSPFDCLTRKQCHNCHYCQLPLCFANLERVFYFHSSFFSDLSQLFLLLIEAI